jgi:hypothetical protein
MGIIGLPCYSGSDRYSSSRDVVERCALHRRDRGSRLRHCDLPCARCNCINQGLLRLILDTRQRAMRRRYILSGLLVIV